MSDFCVINNARDAYNSMESALQELDVVISTAEDLATSAKNAIEQAEKHESYGDTLRYRIDDITSAFDDFEVACDGIHNPPTYMPTFDRNAFELLKAKIFELCDLDDIEQPCSVDSPF